MIELQYLQFIWFTIFVILVTGYVLLDGFDLGVGMLHLFSKKDIERRLMLNSIGPVWDGNEVWLVTAGGALFAGFPEVYATLCSAFYIPIMVFLAGIIFRAVAIEFRSKSPRPYWRWLWDVLFSLASLIIAFALGLLIGNLIQGIPMDEYHEFTGRFSDFINLYAIIVALMAVSLFAMHGSIYLVMKTEGELHEKVRYWVVRCIILFIVFYAITTISTLIFQVHMAEAIRERWFFFLVAILNVFAIANIPREINNGRDGRAFISSCINILCLMTLYAIGSYPNVIRDSKDPIANSLTIFNSSSSETTLLILLLMAVIGVPLVIGYTTGVYWLFRGKVRLEKTSY